MNAGEALAIMRDRLGEDFEDFWDSDRLLDELNDAIRRFCHEERWSWLQTVSTPAIQLEEGQFDYELLDGVDYTRHFDITLQPVTSRSAQDLLFPKKVSPMEGQRLRKRYYIDGDPMYYFLVQSTVNGSEPAPVVRFVPPPDQDFKVEFLYYRDPPNLAQDGDEIEVPEQYCEAPVAWATAKAWLKELPGGVKAQEQFNVYNTVLEQARRDELALADDETFIVGGAEPQNKRPAWSGWLRSHIAEPLGP
jgi:hypothetical protein